MTVRSTIAARGRMTVRSTIAAHARMTVRSTIAAHARMTVRSTIAARAVTIHVARRAMASTASARVMNSRM
jgi:hypothetical protein